MSAHTAIDVSTDMNRDAIETVPLLRPRPRGRPARGQDEREEHERRQSEERTLRLRKLAGNVVERNRRLGQVVKEARQLRGVSISLCAEILDASRQRISDMEAGKSPIGWAEFYYLMDELNMPDEWLARRIPAIARRPNAESLSSLDTLDPLDGLEGSEPVGASGASVPPGTANSRTLGAVGLASATHAVVSSGSDVATASVVASADEPGAVSAPPSTGDIDAGAGAGAGAQIQVDVENSAGMADANFGSAQNTVRTLGAPTSDEVPGQLSESEKQWREKLQLPMPMLMPNMPILMAPPPPPGQKLRVYYPNGDLAAFLVYGDPDDAEEIGEVSGASSEGERQERQT